MSSPDPTRVTFFSDGIQLVGYLYLPPDFQEDQRRSAVLVCHGFGAHQARFLPEIAGHLAAQGHVVMMFDYRGFGESEGPRWKMIPLEQVADIRNALTFLSMQPSVDPDRIGLYGTSFGGANVVYAAAEDSRVQCVVSTVGVGNGARWLRSLRREWEWRDFLGELEEDRETRVTTGKSRVVGRLHIMTPDPDTAAAAEWAQERFPESCSDLPLGNRPGSGGLSSGPDGPPHLAATRALHRGRTGRIGRQRHHSRALRPRWRAQGLDSRSRREALRCLQPTGIRRRYEGGLGLVRAAPGASHLASSGHPPRRA